MMLSMAKCDAALPPAFYRRSAEVVARELLGCRIIRRFDGESLSVRVVETEAYLGAEDRASHGWGGPRTARSRLLYVEGGVAYVYLIYGMHHCLNVVTGAATDGSAVLIRAGEPVAGEGTMRRLRSLTDSPKPGEIAGGPGKLCQALAIDRGLNHCPLTSRDLRIVGDRSVSRDRIAVGPRVGVAYAGEAALWPLRFVIRDHPHASRPRLV